MALVLNVCIRAKTRHSTEAVCCCRPESGTGGRCSNTVAPDKVTVASV